MLFYPELPGLGYSVLKTPKYFNSPSQTHTSGREVRVSYAQYPLWDFTLVYNFLRDTPGITEYRTFLGFFGMCQGSLIGFSLNDPDDNQVMQQAFGGTTDGVSTSYGPIVRSYGAGGYLLTEPVGYVDPNKPFTLYVDGEEVDPRDATYGYRLDTSTPVDQKVVFNSAPSAGHILTATFSYYYYCRFGEDVMEFEKFLHQIYKIKQVKLMSLRG